MFARLTFSRIPRVAARCYSDSLRAKRVPFFLLYIYYIIYFLICQGKAPHVSHSQKAAQKVLEVEWFPTLPILRGASKLFCYCLHMEFRDLGCAYEGHFCEQKNRIWGCAGLVGRCPVVNAPPLYHIYFRLSSKIF